MGNIKPIVGCDIDVCLADFYKAYIKVSRKLFGRPEKNFVVTNYDLSKAGWTQKEVDRIFQYIQHTEDFWRTLEPLPKTKDLTKRYKDANWFFITSRVATDGLPVAIQSEDWLRQTFGLPDPYVIVSYKKGETAKSLDLDYFIDDRMDYVTDVKNAVPSCEVSILATPQSAGFKDSRIHRVESINEWLKTIPVRK